jgi:phosphatidylglycerophosphate synthase
MLDSTLNRWLQRPLQTIARTLLGWGMHANHVTWLGFVLGLTAVPLIAWGYPGWAIVSIALNRLADGLDGSMARLSTPTDRGAFLDICLDFLFYSAIPLAFVLADPVRNGLVGALLIYSFIGTGCTFLAFAVLAAQRGKTSTAFPNKGFYYLGGLTESTETIAVFIAMCLFPGWFSVLGFAFAVLCLVTTALRIRAGLEAFR